MPWRQRHYARRAEYFDRSPFALANTQPMLAGHRSQPATTRCALHYGSRRLDDHARLHIIILEQLTKYATSFSASPGRNEKWPGDKLHRIEDEALITILSISSLI